MNEENNQEIQEVIEDPVNLDTSADAQKNNLIKAVIIGVSIIFGCAIVAGAYVYIHTQDVNDARVDLTTEEESMVWNPDDKLSNLNDYQPKELQTTSTSTATSSDEIDSTPTFGELLASSRSAATKYDLSIDWLLRPEEASLDTLPFKNDHSVSRAYEVGTVLDGELNGSTVYILYEPGMGNDYPAVYVVNDEVVIQVEDWIPELHDLPDTIKDEKNDLQLNKDEYGLFATLLDVEEMSTYSSSTIGDLTFSGAETLPDGQLYTYRQCFFARTPSDLVVEYVIDIPFINDDDEGGYGMLQISYTRINDEKITGEYQIYDRVGYGCGSLCSPLQVVNRVDSDFVMTGTTADGSKLYVLKDVHDDRLEELYNQRNTRAFIDTTSGSYTALESNKYAYDEFLQMAPLLYWKDPLGRWVEFVNTEFIVMAEKCKPVIYLYPETETDLHVEVEPNVGFTKTIPEYKEGWDVIAYPDGTVIDTETGEDYSYLYWAGWVEGYPLVEEEGWVVRQADLPTFFAHYLPLYGLRDREIKDFVEYWEDELDEAPFYAVTFVDQAIIDELSPLSIDKEADVIIRVLMTAQPLERPIPLHAPKLPTLPERSGFTVIEWGGVVLR